MEEARKLDNRPFFVDDDHWQTTPFCDDNRGHIKFRRVLCRFDESLLDHMEFVVEISELVLGLRGRGNQRVKVFADADKDEPCWVTENTTSRNGRRNGIRVYRVEQIFGLLIENEVRHVCFFGSRWRGRRVKGLFDVHEIRGIDDKLTSGALRIENAGFAAKLVHKHRFARQRGRTVWEDLTVGSVNTQLVDSCRFEIECYRHVGHANHCCPTCVEEILKQSSDPGTDAYVGARFATCKTWCSLCV